jgi:predicted RNA binding protein YcfA (HicA-like mRNA interferase family)
MKTYKYKKFEKLLYENGFTYIRTIGDHKIYKRKADEVISLNPNKSHDIKPMTTSKLIKKFSLLV